MKVAISSSGNDQSAQVEPRFGRCQYFIVIDTESGDIKSEANAAQSAGGGAGIQAAQTVADQYVETVLTGNVGPNAHRVPRWSPTWACPEEGGGNVCPVEMARAPEQGPGRVLEALPA
jgi:hypothetical protein